MTPKHIQHLYWRAGFGILPKQLQKIEGKNRIQIVDALFSSSETITSLKVNTSELEKISPKKIIKNATTRKNAIDKSIKKIREFNVAWIGRLANPKELLRERMTLFWANHFVCEDKNIFHIQQYNNTLRKYALGDFRVFVKAISKEAAMIKYLNNKQNIKQSPNENFARELMELFTIGKGNYTEKDIKESARAFTGYNHNFAGEFHLKKLQHDYELKTFFGKTGAFDGDDIIDIILEQKQCAQFICEKIYSYFVKDSLNKTHIGEMISVFYSNYNIETLMRFVFTSNWFYNEENIGSKIKSPIDFLLGMNNVVSMEFKNPKDLIIIQKLLGQILLKPPNVAGWKGGEQWIDSNTIFLRLKLPSVLLNDGYIYTKNKEVFNFVKRARGNKNPFDVVPNWEYFNKEFQDISIEKLKDFVLMSRINKGTNSLLNELSKTSKQDYCIQLMSLPEYQMC
ncbi:MAG: DUF1800 domain-containing protein [Bacteroidetes bacterium]|nr:DUF1800 domain-containing protein [Bacteroidota bacterium]